MNTKDLQSAIELYEKDNYEELESLAQELWPEDSDSLPCSDMAEICRYLSILAIRRDNISAIYLWRARAMSAAILTGSNATIAGLILSPFFELVSEGLYETARQVLPEILRVIPENHVRANLFRGRLYNEKMAYCFAKEKKYAEASKYYEAAARFCENDARGALKVCGGAIITGFLANSSANKASAFINEMAEIVTTATELGFTDVVSIAKANLEVMGDGNIDKKWHPFETE